MEGTCNTDEETCKLKHQKGGRKQIGFLDGSNGKGIYLYLLGSTKKSKFLKRKNIKTKRIISRRIWNENKRNYIGKRKKKKDIKTFILDFIPKQYKNNLIYETETYTFVYK